MSGHVVTAPLVLVKDRTGAVQYHYQGAVLPSYVSKADLARLVDDGMVAPVEPLPVEPAPATSVRPSRRQAEPSPSPVAVEGPDDSPPALSPAKL